MAYPQGINFRLDNTETGFVNIEQTNEDFNLGQTQGDYPVVTAQGNTTGWGDQTPVGRNRVSGNDRRLAGMCFVTDATNPHSFRLDLSAAGDWKVGLALGDASNAQVCSCAIYDDTTLLSTVVTAGASGTNQFYGANGTLYTAANWVTAMASGAALVTLTFASTICNIRMLAQSGAAPNCIAHVYLELVSAAASAKPDAFYRMMRSI